MSNKEMYRLVHRAWHRDRDGNFHTGEALLLACLLHAKGKSRVGDEMKDVQRIMRDKNLQRQ